MSVNVQVDGKKMVVPSGAITYVVDQILGGKANIDEMRKYVSQQELNEKVRDEFGFVDFDHLENGRPTIVGQFYRENTRFGLKLSGKWEETLDKIKSRKDNETNLPSGSRP